MPIAAAAGILAVAAVAIFLVIKRPVISGAANALPDGEKVHASYPPPKKWFAAMPHLQKFFSDGKGLVAEGDWYHADRNLILGTGKQLLRDCILRVIFSGQVSLVLRRTGGKLDSYYMGVFSSRDAHIDLVKGSEHDITSATMALPEPLAKGAEHEAVFVAQGDLLTLWLDGKEIDSAWDSTFSSGSMAVALNKDEGQINQVDFGELLPKSP
jgi:hypothetical protein